MGLSLTRCLLLREAVNMVMGSCVKLHVIAFWLLYMQDVSDERLREELIRRHFTARITELNAHVCIIRNNEAQKLMSNKFIQLHVATRNGGENCALLC